ncbi:MAG: hypothetical protein J2P41_04400 [Blastocatellia bacterium]|nr:hypothetical protein [Blastocatellia bacterium]
MKLFAQILIITVIIIWGGPGFANRVVSETGEQEDPNAQYVVIVSGDLSNKPREIEIPVEAGVLRLQFSVQYSDHLDLNIMSPVGKPLDLSESNISVNETKEKRSISMWDPRPGKWKLIVSGSGKFSAAVTVQGELYFCCLQFFGRTSLQMLDRFQPVRGSQQQAQVFASGFNLDTIEFKLVNEEGDQIAPLKFRQSDYSNPSTFMLLIDTPEQPFRVLARGRDMNGKAFQRVFYSLIRPVAAADSAIAIPPAETAPTAIFNNLMLQELGKDASETEQKIIRAHIENWTDEPLLSEKGNIIGIRLKYSMMFPLDGSYAPYPQLYPERVGSRYAAMLSMRIQKGVVDPLPQITTNHGQMVIGVRADYKPDTTYNFTVDMLPNYVTYNEHNKNFCLQTKAYGQQVIREKLLREEMNEMKVRFRLSISGTDIDGRQPALTENAYSPGLWFQNLVKEGITDCN